MEKIKNFVRFLERTTDEKFALSGFFVTSDTAYAVFEARATGWAKVAITFMHSVYGVQVHFAGTDIHEQGHHQSRDTRFTNLDELFEAIDNDLETTYKELILDGVFCFTKL